MIPYTPYLTTLEYVRRNRRLATAETDDDALLTQFIAGASTAVARECDRVFVPYRATYAYDAIGAHIGGFGDQLYLDDDDLLEITTFTNGDASTIAGSALALQPANTYPKHEIRLKSSSGVVLTYTDDWEQALSIAGWWGNVPHYASAWKSQTTLNGAINASVTSVVLTSGSGVEIGSYLKLDAEIVRVTALVTHTATVVRGELGTTSAAHDSAATVYAYQFIPDLQFAVSELVSYLYKNKDNIGGRVTVFDGGILQVTEIDPLVKDIIRNYKRAVHTAV